MYRKRCSFGRLRTYFKNQEYKTISVTHTRPVPAHLINQRRLRITNRLQKKLNRRTARKRLIRYSLIIANLIVLGGVVTFVAMGSQSNHVMASGVVSATNAVVPTPAQVTPSQPVDGLTSYDIAANVARMANLPEVNAISNQAQSARVAVDLSISGTGIAPKPQIVATALKSRKNIKMYVVEAGDTVTSIANKFGVSADSIRWSNNLNGNIVALGTKLEIPPINGIVYTVKTGDTVQSLAAKYKVSSNAIISYNDAELSGIHVGERVLIPNGQITIPTYYAYAGIFGGSFTPQYNATTGGACGRWKSVYPCLYGNNGYDYGWCTWYVASRIAVPSNWGNAQTWAYYAARSGWVVTTIPRAGAIAQTTTGDHVAYVEKVSADGSEIVYSDMNGLAGWGRVGTSGWVPASHFEHYIYR